MGDPCPIGAVSLRPAAEHSQPQMLQAQHEAADVPEAGRNGTCATRAADRSERTVRSTDPGTGDPAAATVTGAHRTRSSGRRRRSRPDATRSSASAIASRRWNVHPGCRTAPVYASISDGGRNPRRCRSRSSRSRIARRPVPLVNASCSTLPLRFPAPILPALDLRLGERTRQERAAGVEPQSLCVSRGSSRSESARRVSLLRAGLSPLSVPLVMASRAPVCLVPRVAFPIGRQAGP